MQQRRATERGGGRRALVGVGVVVAVVLAGSVAFVAARGQSCDDVFEVSETRLVSGPDQLAGPRTRPSPDSGIGELQWVLTTNESNPRARLVDLGAWSAYINDDEISRLDGDGTIRWTRATSSTRVAILGDGLLGVIGPVDNRFHLAVLDASGDLVHCRQLGRSSVGLSGDGAGGFAATGPDPALDRDGLDDPERTDTVLRVEADGTERWRAELDANQGRFVDQVAVGGDVTAIGRPGDQGGLTIAVFDDATGQLRWTIEGNPDLLPLDGLAGVVGDLLYATVESDDFFDDTLVAIEIATGDVRWSTSTGLDTSGARLEDLGDTVVLRSSTNALAVDPDSGLIEWAIVGERIPFDQGDHGATVDEVDGALLFPAAGGRLIDLRTGRWSRLFDEAPFAFYEGMATSDGHLIVGTAVRPEGGTNSWYLSGWAFAPDTAVLDQVPTGPAAP